jgi:putative spermidine/putrescine transport system permease protein
MDSGPVGNDPSGRLSLSAFTNAWGLLVLPGVLFLIAFFGYPLAEMAVRSVTDPSPANYQIFFSSPVYLRTLLTTLEISLLVTVVCLVLGYLYAYVMSLASPRVAGVMIVLVLLPFWSSSLVRVFAWTLWLDDVGVINTMLRDLGLTQAPLMLMRNTLGVTIGMSQVLLPYMVLPLYAVMRRIDRDLPAAAAGLGASPMAAFRRVFFPLSLPGVYAGALLVFVLSLGFYIAPAVLGGSENTMLSQLIIDEVQVQLQFGVGSAISIVLLAITLIILWLGTRFVSINMVIGSRE